MNDKLVSRRKFLQTTALALPFAAAGCAAAQTNQTAPTASLRIPKAAGDFVGVRNGRFELRGRPYFYVGANLWYGCYLSDPALADGRQRLVRELDRLQAIGAKNIRLLAGSETSPLAGAIPRGITRAPRDWDEDLLELFRIPRALLPRVLPSSHPYGETAKKIFGAPIAIAGIVGHLRSLSYPAGTMVIRKGEVGDSMYFIVTGAVEVRVGPRTIALREGNFFGEMALLDRKPRSADVVTETPCRVYRLSAERFARLERENPATVIQFHSFVVKLLAKRLSAASDEIRALL